MYEDATANRGIRFLIFLAYSAAALLILVGFFVMTWDPFEIIDTGSQLTRTLMDEMIDQIEVISESAFAIGDIFNSDEVIREIVEQYWPVLAIWFVIVIGIGYLFSAFWSFIFMVIGRPLMPVRGMGCLFVVLGMVATVFINLALPLAILVGYDGTFFDGTDPGTGFWLTGAGVVLGGLTPLVVDFVRFFVRPPSMMTPVQYQQMSPGMPQQGYQPQQGYPAQPGYPPQGQYRPGVNPQQGYPPQHNPQYGGQPGQYPPQNPLRPDTNAVNPAQRYPPQQPPTQPGQQTPPTGNYPPQQRPDDPYSDEDEYPW